MHISVNLVIQKRRGALRPSVDLLDDRCLLSASALRNDPGLWPRCDRVRNTGSMVTRDGSGDGKGLEKDMQCRLTGTAQGTFLFLEAICKG